MLDQSNWHCPICKQHIRGVEAVNPLTDRVEVPTPGWMFSYRCPKCHGILLTAHWNTSLSDKIIQLLASPNLGKLVEKMEA